MKIKFIRSLIIASVTGGVLMLWDGEAAGWQKPRQEQSRQKKVEKQQQKETSEQQKQVEKQQQRKVDQRQQQEHQLIQQRRLNQYNQLRQQQDRLARQREQFLQQQRRLEQLRFQQQYLERLRQDRIRLQNARPNENSDFIYRYSRGGNYYRTNQYGVDMIRQALNYGYEQGYRAGQADRGDRARFSCRDSYAYQDATYGYNGFDVDLSEYRYYFREGFIRGCQDGYNSRFRYGRNDNGVFSLMDNILRQIFNAQP